MSDTIKRYGKILVLIVMVLVFLVLGGIITTWSSAQPEAIPDTIIKKEDSYTHYYVSPDGDDKNYGTSWNEALQTIQLAIDASYDGDTVWVAEGTYSERINFKGKAITLTSINPTDLNVVAATIIDGGGDQSQLQENKPKTGSVVTFAKGEDAKSVLTGFTVTGGYAAGKDWDGNGGGIICYQSSPTISNCIIMGNDTQNCGGGIYLYQSKATISYCLIGEYKPLLQGRSNPTEVPPFFLSRNIADFGGGMFCDYSSPIIEYCTIFGNAAYEDGGGIYNYESSPTLTDCLVWGNSDRGGWDEHAQIYGGTPHVDYCFIQSWTGSLDPNGVGNNGVDPSSARSAFMPEPEVLEQYPGDPFGGMMMLMGGAGRGENLVINDYTQDEYDTIQEAIDEALDTHTLIAYPSIYYENIDFKGKDITLESIDPDDPNIVATTIIDGRSLKAAVTFAGTEESSTPLQGFTITGSYPAPAGYWKFDETEDTIAYDSTLYERNGTLNNMNDDDWVTGKYGNALDFDGTNDYVEIEGYQGISGANPRTITAWIKTDEERVIVYWGKYQSGKWWIFHVNNYAPKGNLGAIRVSVYGRWITGSTDIRDDKWHHVAVVLPEGVDDVEDLLFYVDGNLETISDSQSKTINTAEHDNVYIGVYNTSDTSENLDWYFDGLIDEVQIHPRALSAQEVRKLYYGIADDGGIDGKGASATISKSIIRDNYSAISGGGIRNLDGKISHCSIFRNTAYEDGGGLYNCNGTIKNCLIYDNLSDYGGGLFQCEGRIENCTIADNLAYYDGAGLGDSALARFKNNIVWGNYYGQLYDPNYIYEPNYCDIQGWSGGGTGNIDANPQFVHTYLYRDSTVADGAKHSIIVNDAYYYEPNDVIEYNDDGVPRTVTMVDPNSNIITFEPNLVYTSLAFVNIHNWGDDPDSDSTTDPNFVIDDYHLQVISPCIDAGDPDSDWSNEPDYPDPNGCINMGAYGNTPEAAVAGYYYTSESDGDGIPDWWEDMYEFMDPEDFYDRDLDYDHDGLSNQLEWFYGCVEIGKEKGPGSAPKTDPPGA